MSAEGEALRQQAIREWDSVIREAWRAHVVLKDLGDVLEEPAKPLAAIVRKKLGDVLDHVDALNTLADALDPPPEEPKRRPGMHELMRTKDIAAHIAGQFRCHRSTCTEGTLLASRLARWSHADTPELLRRLRQHAAHLEHTGRHIGKALEEYELADVVYPDFDIDGIPLEGMEAFVSLLATTLPLSGPDR